MAFLNLNSDFILLLTVMSGGSNVELRVEELWCWNGVKVGWWTFVLSNAALFDELLKCREEG